MVGRRRLHLEESYATHPQNQGQDCSKRSDFRRDHRADAGNCMQIRDVAMIDLLYSTGIRVGELVNPNSLM